MVIPIGYFSNKIIYEQIYANNIEATSSLDSRYVINNVINYNLPNSGGDTNGWFAGYNIFQNKIIIDFGSPIKLQKITYNNYHHAGEFTWIGAKDIEIFGGNATPNTNFNDLTGLTFIKSGSLLEHTAGDAEQLHDLILENKQSFKYYVIRILSQQRIGFFVNGVGLRKLYFFKITNL